MFGRKKIPGRRDWWKIVNDYSRPTDEFRLVYWDFNAELQIYAAHDVPPEIRKNLESKRHNLGVSEGTATLAFFAEDPNFRRKLQENMVNYFFGKYGDPNSYILMGERYESIKVYSKCDRNLIVYVGTRDVNTPLGKFPEVILVIRKDILGKIGMDLYSIIEESYKQYKEQKKK